MFTIDLMKGRCRPVKTEPKGVAIFVATYAVPVLIAMLMVGFYIRNEVLISVNQQNITSFDNQIKRLDDAVKLKESCEKNKASINACLGDVSTSIKKHIQWSPILVTLAENLPDSVVLTKLEVKQTSSKRKAGAKADSGKKADGPVTVRMLKMSVSGNPSYNCDLDVKTFRDRLRASSTLGPKLEDVIIASQGHEVLDGRDVITYDIDCVFKPEL
jgi:Tfp pilus assembly protein PilN